jgi:hypothetical protein
MSVKFQAPNATTPGFLKRMKRALSFSEQIQAGKLSAEMIDGLVEFLVDFVIEPINRDEAKDLLLDASQEQFEQMLAAVTGGNAAVPLPNSEP